MALNENPDSDMKISVVVLTKNNEAILGECLEALSKFDEIIVVDDNSIDNTTTIAKKYGAFVYSRNLNGDFAKQRNFGLSKAQNDWVLYIDSDELVDNKLYNEIRQGVESSEFDGFYIPRRDLFFGKELKYGEWGSTKLLRLGKKSHGQWVRTVHETWTIDGRVGMLHAPIIHFAHKTIDRFILKINRYAALHSFELQKENKKSSLLKIIFFPAFKLISNLVFKKGVLDGNHGVVFAIVMSFHSFLAWSTLYLNQRKR